MLVSHPKLILLHEADNVLVCVAPFAAGESLAIDGVELRAGDAVGVGHKVARRAIRPGERVFKYGAPIGSATRDVAPGEWVHSHNMQSDYIPSHDRKAGAEGNVT